GIDTFWVPELPVAIQIFLAMRVVGTADDFAEGISHQARSTIRDPHGEIVNENSGEFSAQLTEPREDWLNGVVIPALVQFEATEEGTYTIEQFVDDAQSSVPIHVALGAPPG